jgi:hypothetical protein
MDIAVEPESVHRMYGTRAGQVSFADNCLGTDNPYVGRDHHSDAFTI